MHLWMVYFPPNIWRIWQWDRGENHLKITAIISHREILHSSSKFQNVFVHHFISLSSKKQDSHTTERSCGHNAMSRSLCVCVVPLIWVLIGQRWDILAAPLKWKHAVIFRECSLSCIILTRLSYAGMVYVAFNYFFLCGMPTLVSVQVLVEVLQVVEIAEHECSTGWYRAGLALHLVHIFWYRNIIIWPSSVSSELNSN